jgi:hypothetical protein
MSSLATWLITKITYNISSDRQLIFLKKKLLIYTGKYVHRLAAAFIREVKIEPETQYVNGGYKQVTKSALQQVSCTHKVTQRIHRHPMRINRQPGYLVSVTWY